MAFDNIEFMIEDGVATLALNRPDRLNSFNESMHREVREALAQVEQARRDGECRALLLTGNGRGFCAGQDLSDRAVSPEAGADAAPDLGYSIETWYNPLVRTLTALPLPVVCAVNGVAAGAGANIALACDLVIAARSANFIQAFCKLGLLPDSGGTWQLPRLVGPARAKGLAMLGDKLSAEQAADWGLIWQVVDDETLMDTATGLARHLATQPTRGLALIKQALNESTGNDLDTQLDLERDLQRQAGASQDYREGVSAFMEKRAPRFTGQ
jgi:2-(1,2-epoxy-1,2-dihydrophenyl)acetyl-CoA isomerase